MITIHGSILTAPGTARDCDVVFSAPHTQHSAEEAARQYMQAHGLDARPVDAQESHRIPALPVGTLPPALRLDGHGALPQYERQYDVAAWIRACATEEGRSAFLRAWHQQPTDTRRIGETFGTTGVVLVTRQSPPGGSYHGGGPIAIRTAIAKCPGAWAWMREQIPQQAALIEAVAEGAALSPAVQAQLGGAPGSSNGEVQLCAEGIVAAYKQQPLPWDAVALTSAVRALLDDVDG